MNQNAELLNFIYQNSEMGIETLEQIIKIVEDETFKKQLESQLREYQEINGTAKDMLNRNSYTEKEISTWQKVSAYMGISFQTLSDRSVTHIAEMLIKGSNMGIIDAIKNLRKYAEAEKDIVKLMEKLYKFEENNVKALKQFL